MSTRLDIYSDPVCPWCYLGLATLGRVLGPSHPFAIRWRPFQLDPGIPPEGLDRQAYLQARFPDPARIDAIHGRLEAMGAEAGIRFRFDRITRAPNTLDAHRLIHWAEPFAAQTAVAAELFRRYFEEGEDISDPSVLRAAAEAAGLDGAAIAQLLAGGADRDTVAAEIAEAGRIGVTAVPTYVLGGRYVLSGAQTDDFWARLIGDLDAAGLPG
ncbi:MAG: DsbA family oxidoreductase [Amaricoccus sp.]